MTKLTFVTGNKVKAEQLQRHLKIPVRHEAIDLIEIQSLDVIEIVEDKARQAYKKIMKPVLVEDFSIQLIGLNKFPGPLLKWFTESLNGDEICRLLDGKSREAIAQIGVAICDENGTQSFLGEIKGTIALTPRVKGSFMFESLFIPEGSDKTWSEMPLDAKLWFSVRARAYKKVREYVS